MIIKAQQKYIRMSPRKVRLVAKAVDSLEPKEALVQLSHMRKVAADEVAKVIKQAMANATKNLGLKEEYLRFQSIQVDEGATFKRWRAVSRGRAHSIYKRTSHITVYLESEENPEKPDKLEKPKVVTKHKKGEAHGSKS